MAKVSKRRGKWVADFRDQQGRRRWITCTTRKEAEAALSKALTHVREGEYQSKRDAVKFEALAQSFLENAKTSVRCSTATDYESTINSHLIPNFKGIRVRDISLRIIEQFRSDLLERLRANERARLAKVENREQIAEAIVSEEEKQRRRGKIYVRRAYTSGRFVDPKTRAGRRIVDIPGSLVSELRRWKLRCPKGDLDLFFQMALEKLSPRRT